MPAPDPDSYRVIYRELHTDVMTPAGRVRADATHRLEVIAAEERFAKPLAAAVAAMNQRSKFTISAPPPEGAPRFSLHGRVVAREAADAREAMRAMFAEEYRMTLEPD